MDEANDRKSNSVEMKKDLPALFGDVLEILNKPGDVPASSLIMIRGYALETLKFANKLLKPHGDALCNFLSRQMKKGGSVSFVEIESTEADKLTLRCSLVGDLEPLKEVIVEYVIGGVSIGKGAQAKTVLITINRTQLEEIFVVSSDSAKVGEVMKQFRANLHRNLDGF